MSLAKLAVQIAKREGHNSKARIEDLKEILIILADLSYASPDPLNTVIKLGILRSKRKQKNAVQPWSPDRVVSGRDRHPIHHMGDRGHIKFGLWSRRLVDQVPKNTVLF